MLYLIIFLIFVFIMIYTMPVTISLDIERAGKDDKITIGIRTIYGLLKLKSEIPFLELIFKQGRPAVKYKVELANKKRNKLLTQFTKLFTLDDNSKLFEILRKEKHRLLSAMKYIAGKTTIRKFHLRLSLGTGDAAETGVLYGAAWIVIGCIVTMTRSLVDMGGIRIKVVPIFDQVLLRADFSCIIHIRLGHIINTGIRLIPVLLTSKK